MWSIEKENESLFLTILGQRATDPITKKGYGEIVAVSRGKSGEEITVNIFGASIFRFSCYFFYTLSIS